MKRVIITLQLLVTILCAYSQSDDTLSTNIYQKDGKLGIGTSSPENLLHIEGYEDDWPGRVFLSIKNNSNSAKSLAYITAKAGTDGDHVVFGHISKTYAANGSPLDLQNYGILTSNGEGLILGATKNDKSSGVIKFLSGQEADNTFIERMRINSDGNVGIGTDAPSSKLEIKGDESGYGTDGRVMLNLRNISDSDYSCAMMKLSSGTGSTYTVIGHTAESYYNSCLRGFGSVQAEGPGLVLRSQSENGIIKFMTGTPESGSITDDFTRMVIDAKGDIGIGTLTPEAKLHLYTEGTNDSDRTLMKLHNTSTSGKAFTSIKLYTGDGTTFSSIADMGLTYNASPAYDFAGFLSLSNLARGVILHASSPEGTIKMYTGYDASAGAGIERFRIDSAGNVGIGTDAPQAKLHVADGDIFISDINRGIIMKSPDGQCWRGVLDNNGQLNFSQVDCSDLSAGTTATAQTMQIETSVSIFPNPTSGEFIIELSDEESLISMQYEIFSVNGELLETNSIKSEYTKLDISAFPSGSYFVRVRNQNNELVKSQEIIKK